MATVRHPVRADGRTQASTLMPVLRWRSAASATVIQSLTPSNARSLRNLPVVCHVGPLSVPVCPLPEPSAVVVPVPSSKPKLATSPVGAGTVLLVVTLRAADVVVLPSVSRATAVSACAPLAAVAELHVVS